jgi:hypothetical protein
MTDTLTSGLRHLSWATAVGSRGTLALLFHFVWGVGFIILLRAVQEATLPARELTGIDLTSHAIRDEWMIRGFALSLLLGDLLFLRGIGSWSQRIAVVALGLVMSAVTFVVVIMALLAG